MLWSWWLATGVLATLSTLLIIVNPLAAIHAKSQGRYYSFFPIIGGISGALACITCPWAGARWWWWLPLLLDLSIPMAIYAFLIYIPWLSVKNAWLRISGGDEPGEE